MKQFTILIATLGLTATAFLPTAALADDELDDLDVTMEVLADESELDDIVSEMRGPDDDGPNDGGFAEGGDATDDVQGENEGVLVETRNEESDEMEDAHEEEEDDLVGEDLFEHEDGDHIDDEDEFDEEVDEPDDPIGDEMAEDGNDAGDELI